MARCEFCGNKDEDWNIMFFKGSLMCKSCMKERDPEFVFPPPNPPHKYMDRCEMCFGENTDLTTMKNGHRLCPWCFDENFLYNNKGHEAVNGYGKRMYTSMGVIKK